MIFFSLQFFLLVYSGKQAATESSVQSVGKTIGSTIVSSDPTHTLITNKWISVRVTHTKKWYYGSHFLTGNITLIWNLVSGEALCLVYWVKGPNMIQSRRYKHTGEKTAIILKQPLNGLFC